MPPGAAPSATLGTSSSHCTSYIRELPPCIHWGEGDAGGWGRVQYRVVAFSAAYFALDDSHGVFETGLDS